MKTKKKLLLEVRHSSESSEASRKGRRLELPAAIADDRIWCPPRNGDTVAVASGLVLPRVYEWTFVPGPDEIQ